jgi:hypothetical protein
MNDELSGQIADKWNIPNYAQEMLWLSSEFGAVQAEGPQGAFTLPAPAEVLTIRWGGPDGAPLAQLRWKADSLDWDGRVRIGGYIDAMFIGEVGDLPEPVSVLHVGGQPLRPNTSPFPRHKDRRNLPYPLPSFEDGIATEVHEGMTTWIAYDEAPALSLAQDALVSKLRVYCFGRLAPHAWAWHKQFAEPIVLEAMTLFAP